MRVRDPDGTEWADASVVPDLDGELGIAGAPGALGSRRAIHEVARPLELGDRSVVPRGGERVLCESPLWTSEV